jgi:hypothetical protein
MSKILKFLSLMTVAALCAFAAPKRAEAAHCVTWAGSFCLTYAPDPIAGMTMVSNTYVPAQGEWVGCESSGTYCVKAALGAGGSWNIANLGDFATSGGTFGNWPIKTVKSRMCQATHLYTGFNWTGSDWSYLGNCTSLYSVTLPGGSSPSSMTIHN